MGRSMITRRVWDNPHLLMYIGGILLGAGATLMLLWVCDQITGRPLFLTSLSLTLASAFLLERAFRLLMQHYQQVDTHIEDLHRKASTPWE